MPAFTDDLTRLSDKTLRTLANTAAWDVAVAAENELERRHDDTPWPGQQEDDTPNQGD